MSSLRPSASSGARIQKWCRASSEDVWILAPELAEGREDDSHRLSKRLKRATRKITDETRARVKTMPHAAIKLYPGSEQQKALLCDEIVRTVTATLNCSKPSVCVIASEAKHSCPPESRG